jgi:ferredoxin
VILYFSGTGNSRYAAQVIQSVTGDELVSLNDLIKAGKQKPISSAQPLVFVTPVYAWRIPRVVEKYIRQTSFQGNTKAYFIASCGSEPHNAASYTKKLCKAKGFDFQGFKAVVMPENYIALYEAPDKETAAKQIQDATPILLEVADKIKKGQLLQAHKASVGAKFMSSAVNPAFYRFIVSAKGFRSTEACISCGTCVQACPLNNIKLSDGEPAWGKKCTHCMACICICPKKAIEYKHKTEGKNRYFNSGYPQASA